MEYVDFGRTGLKVSVAGLGCGGNSRLGLGRGKKLHDKRDTKAKKDVERRIAKEIGRRT